MNRDLWLVERYLDGTLDESERAELGDRLAADAALMQDLLSSLEMEAGLRQAYHQTQRMAAARRRTLVWRAAAAVLILGLMLGLIVVVRPPAAPVDPFAFTDGTRLQPLTSGVVLREDRGDPAAGRRLRLERGAIAAEVATQPPGRPLTIATPDGEAVVLGTAFTLTVDDHGTDLAVRHGLVELRAAGEATSVGAGQRVALNRGRSTPRAGLLLWLRADRGLEVAADGAVAAWADAHDPTLVARPAGERGPRLEGGRHPGVRFTDADALALWPGFADLSAGFTCVAVLTAGGEGDHPRFLEFGVDDAEVESKLVLSAMGHPLEYYGLPAGMRTWLQAPDLPVGQRALLTIVVPPAAAATVWCGELRVAGGEHVVLPPVRHRDRNLLGQTSWGADGRFTGAVHELLVYSRALGDEERLTLIRELARHHDLPAATGVAAPSSEELK